MVSFVAAKRNREPYISLPEEEANLLGYPHLPNAFLHRIDGSCRCCREPAISRNCGVLLPRDIPKLDYIILTIRLGCYNNLHDLIHYE